MVDFSNQYNVETLGTPQFGDLLMRNGDLVLTSDADPRGTNNVAQDVIIRLRTFLSEVFVDQSLGVPYYQQLLGQKSASPTWDAVLQNVVLQTPGVRELTTWSSQANTRTRTLTVNFAAVTSSGPISYNGTIDLNAT